MTDIKTQDKQQLPKLQDLHHSPDVAFKNDQFKLLVNQEPPVKFIKQHPIIKQNGQPLLYIPIDKTEFMLDRIFQEWKVTVLNVCQLFNSVAVTIRLEYKSPLTGEWLYHDGVGAMGIQTDAGKQASDMSAIKQDAVMKALPAAKSYAIKDAADHIGILFGRNLTRKDTVAFTGSYENPENLDATAEQYVFIERLLTGSSLDDEQKANIDKHLEVGITASYASELITMLQNNQREPINSGDNYSQGDISKKIRNEVH